MALTTNLIAYWELEEASGTRVDAHGNNDLADNATVTSATGKVGDGADFETGNSEYLSIASNSDLQMGDIDFTICAWVKFESVIIGSQMIVAKDVDSPGSSRDYTLAIDASDFPTFYINGGGSGALGVTGVQNLSAAIWYFICAWHNAAADTLNIQLNNGTPDVNVGTGGAVPQTTSAEFRIGARAYASFEGYADGVIDQVGIWKRVLTTDERTDLYNSGNGRSYAYVLSTGGSGDLLLRLQGEGAFL